MNIVEPYRDPKLVEALAADIKRIATQPIRVMEVCGTHTVAIFRHGLRTLLPPAIELLSGPGCPVCVTATADINLFLEAARRPEVRIATFGDLLRVPGSTGSLAEAKAQGAKVEIVYSPFDALRLAETHPRDLVVFLAVGFETTAPGVAATLMEVRRRGLENFLVLPAHKTMPAALSALLADPDLAVDGLLCPGHVSAIIGSEAYRPIAETYRLPCAVAGFEPVDILQAILALVRQVTSGRAEVENAYPRAVSAQGNPRALAVMETVFEPADAEWRGLGRIPESGLDLVEAWEDLNAAPRLGLQRTPAPEPKGCLCGEILRGTRRPGECPLFGSACTPLSPIGPCMVSSEGTCAAYYRYGGSTI